MSIDMRGINPAPVTPFTPDGDIDIPAIHRLGSWLGSIDGVKSLVVLGHAGEGTFMSQEEKNLVVREFVASTGGRVPVVAGISLEGTGVAVEESKQAVESGAQAALVYPPHGWLRFGYQKGASSRSLPCDLRGSWVGVYSFPIPRCDQSNVRSRSAVGDRRHAWCICGRRMAFAT